jgi:hypothetical protein
VNDTNPTQIHATGEATGFISAPGDKGKPITVIGTNSIRAGFDATCLQPALNARSAPGVTDLVLNPDAHAGYGTPAYRQLSAADKQRLEQVHRDLVLLWGALNMYADEHNGSLPATLDDLVPNYLVEFPSDPFATQETAGVQTTYGVTQSKNGMGYRFRRGAPGKRAWVISSVGLEDFPYLAERGNVGLYICKGIWISGQSDNHQMTATSSFSDSGM